MVRLGGRGVPWKSAKDGAGFTLIELVVTVLILAILITVGVPSFSDATLGSRLGSYANELMTSAYLARSEAMKRNLPVTLCTSTCCFPRYSVAPFSSYSAPDNTCFPGLFGIGFGAAWVGPAPPPILRGVGRLTGRSDR
jgi:prepilin-type N-terminal cleavage/methylation domain-containing protein